MIRFHCMLIYMQIYRTPAELATFYFLSMARQFRVCAFSYHSLFS